mgnify:CR=1 FL=1
MVSRGLRSKPVLIAGTWKGNAHEIYLNGIDASGKQTGNELNINSQETLKIGAQVTGTGIFFNGLIDEAAVCRSPCTHECFY